MCGAEHLGLVGIGAKKNDPGEPHQVHFVEEKHAVAPPLIYLKVRSKERTNSTQVACLIVM